MKRKEAVQPDQMKISKLPLRAAINPYPLLSRRRQNHRQNDTVPIRRNPLTGVISLGETGASMLSELMIPIKRQILLRRGGWCLFYTHP